MKQFVCFFLILALGSSTFKKTENDNLGTNDISKTISQSFKVGNSDLLSTCFNKEIELIIDGDKIEFQKLPSNSAKSILNSFFKKNPPLSFNYVYQGNSSTTLKYCIGNYKSKTSDFFVYMLIKKNNNDKFLISTIQLKKG